MEDGVLFRHAPDEFMLTAAEPNLSHLRTLARGKDVEIVDVSEDYAVLALQGPRSRAILEPLAPEIARAVLLLLHPRQGRRPRGHREPHRLHRRPRL